MDVPVLTAVIAVGGSLMGTIIGGCLTMYSNFFLNKLRERAEFRIGCRLISGEFEENGSLLRNILESKSFVRPEVTLLMEAWDEHQHVLASYLSDEAWRDVRAAVRATRLCRMILAVGRSAEHLKMDDTTTQLWAVLVEDVVKGQTSLGPYL